jgi:7-carboxy-7-deazaguanine synthase
LHYQISEIFHSIQGEGPLAGLPTTFVRTVGCPLRCAWCDTEYAFRGGESLSYQQIKDEILSHSLPAICVTGGEPLAKESGYELVRALAKEFPKQRISVETSGAFLTHELPRSVVRVVDWKAPSSGEGGTFKDLILNDLTKNDALKFVIDSTDFDWFLNVYRSHKLDQLRPQILLHPIFGSLELHELAAWMVQHKLNARLGVQLHKLVWPEAEKGR